LAIVFSFKTVERAFFGLKNVILQGVEVVQCPQCGDEQIIIPRLDELMRTLAFAVISQPYRLQGEDVRFLRKYLKMTQAEFASYLEIDKTNLSKWENNDDRIGEQSDRLIRSISLALGDGLKEAHGGNCALPQSHRK